MGYRVWGTHHANSILQRKRLKNEVQKVAGMRLMRSHMGLYVVVQLSAAICLSLFKYERVLH